MSDGLQEHAKAMRHHITQATEQLKYADSCLRNDCTSEAQAVADIAASHTALAALLWQMCQAEIKGTP